MNRQELVAQLECCLARRRQLEWQLFVLTPVRQRSQLLRELAQVKQEHGRLEDRLKRLQTPGPSVSRPLHRRRWRFRQVVAGFIFGLFSCWLLLNTSLFLPRQLASNEASSISWISQSVQHGQLFEEYQQAISSGNLEQQIKNGEQILAEGGSFIGGELVLLYKERGSQRLAAKQYGPALSDFQRYEALLRRQAEFLSDEDYVEEGQAYLGLGQPKAGLNVFTTAIARNSSYSPAYYYAALTSVQLHDNRSAILYYRQIIGFGENDPYYQTALEGLRRLLGSPE